MTAAAPRLSQPALRNNAIYTGIDATQRSALRRSLPQVFSLDPGLKALSPARGASGGRVWTPVPHGRALVACLPGQLLQYVSQGAIEPCEHRVAQPQPGVGGPRVALVMRLRGRSAAQLPRGAGLFRMFQSVGAHDAAFAAVHDSVNGGAAAAAAPVGGAAAPVGAAEVPAAGDPSRHLSVQLIALDGTSVCFRVRSTSSMLKVFTAYAAHVRQEISRLRFMAPDGTRIAPHLYATETPDSLGLEDGGTMEVFPEQAGD